MRALFILALAIALAAPTAARAQLTPSMRAAAAMTAEGARLTLTIPVGATRVCVLPWPTAGCLAPAVARSVIVPGLLPGETVYAYAYAGPRLIGHAEAVVAERIYLPGVTR